MIILGCFLTSNVSAREWSKQEVTKEIAFQVINVAEKALTYDLIHDNDELSESNTWLYGSDPSAEDLAVWAIGAGAIHWLLTDYFIDYDTPESTAFFQDLTLAVYGGVFLWNLHFKF